jgi:HSP20 family protein
MEEIARIPVVPTITLGHDKDNYTIEVELPGVHKKDIDFEAAENSFCLSAPRDDIEYFGCWMLAHAIDPKKATATFSNGLLRVTAPLVEIFEGVKVPIK